MRFFTLLPCLLLACSGFAAEPSDLSPIKKWLARQDELRSVQADFVQTRSLRALRSPIATPGHIWFGAPDSVRWELGDPAKIVVLRKGDLYFLIQPARKKAERYHAENVAEHSGSLGFAMLNFPIAKDLADFHRQFEVLGIAVTEGRCHLEMLPREAQARRALEAIKIDFETTTGHLLAFELVTRDGSSMRNDFTNTRVNQKIDRRVFDYDFTSYEIIDARN